jgi:hypothetical protein
MPGKHPHVLGVVLNRSERGGTRSGYARGRRTPIAANRLSPEVFEPIGGQLGIAHRVLDVPRFQRSLNCLSYVANSKRVGHGALLWPSGGSISAIDSLMGVTVGDSRHRSTAMRASLGKPPRESLC